MNLTLMTFLADAAKFANMEYGEKMLLGLTVTAIGIMMVFVILFLIILSVKLMNVCLDKMPALSGKLKFKNKAKAERNVEQKIDVDSSIEKEPIYVTDDKKVAAAITAALYQLQEEENCGRKPNIAFKINSIKKI